MLFATWFVVTQPIILPSSEKSGRSVDAERLKTHVKTLSETFVPRDWKHVENLDRAAHYITQELIEGGGHVTEQAYRMRGDNTMRGETYRNVIASFGPDTGERIVVGAHYDAYSEYPAADDNASGVAVLIELARLLNGNSLPMRVDLVAYALEEPFAEGALGNFRTPDGGSAVHAASLKAAGIRVRLMFSLETMGFFSDEKNSQGFPISLLKYFYPTQGNYVLVVSRLGQMGEVRTVKSAMRGATELPVYSINAPASVEGIDYSDHYNYWKNGYPAVMITDTAFNRNKAYHTAGDTADRLDYRRLAMATQAIHDAVLAMAK